MHFASVQAAMALFAQALHGAAVRIAEQAAGDPDLSACPVKPSHEEDLYACTPVASHVSHEPGEALITLRPAYDSFANREDNLGACRVDVLRGVIELQAPLDLQLCPPPPGAGEASGFLRILWSLRGLVRDSLLQRTYPGARQDLRRVRQRELGQSGFAPVGSANALQNQAIMAIEAFARAPDRDGSYPLFLGQEVQQLRQPGVGLHDALSTAIRISETLGLPLPAGLAKRTELQGLKGPAFTVSDAAESGQDEDKTDIDGGPLNLVANTRSSDTTFLQSGTAGQGKTASGGNTTQVPMSFDLHSIVQDENQGPASASARQAFVPPPELTTRHGRLHPEWHYLQGRHLPAWCRVFEHRLRGLNTQFIKEVRQRHGRLAGEIRRQLAGIRPRHLRRQAGMREGEEIDLEAVIGMVVDRHSGGHLDDRLYQQRVRTRREVSAALLIDMSGSTNITMPPKKSGSAPQPVPDQSDDYPYLYGGGMHVAGPQTPPRRRVIDVAKDALALMCDAAQGLGDAFAIYGFSGDGRHQVDFFVAKEFSEPLSGRVWAALSAIEPKRSSRLGPAIRHTIWKFRKQSDVQRLLIIVSDGYPQDSDYGPTPDEVDYGIEDSAQAIREARRAGIQTCFITIDPAGNDYMGRLCPEGMSILIDDLEDLPRALGVAYGGLRQSA